MKMGKNICTTVTTGRSKLATLPKSSSTKFKKLQGKRKRSATVEAQVETEDLVVDPELKAIRAMAEELLKKLNCYSSLRSLPHHVNSIGTRSLKLVFVGNIPDTLITFSNIQDQGASLWIELQDSSGSRVECGPEASIKIKLYVLHGEFEVEEMDDWTREDFDNNVAHPRMDKGPLLKGMHEIYMRNGFATLTDIAFTDNSKCMRNATFRLGARAMKGVPRGVRVREAVTGAFRVKERRVKFYRKHKNPCLEDSTHFLKNVGHALCLKLAKDGIHTVRDFLQLYHTDENKLKSILQVAESKWTELIKTVKLCQLSDDHYRYCDKGSGIELHLDCVFNIVRVMLNNKVNMSYEDLDDSQKELVNKVRLAAYEKRKELERICDPINPTSPEGEFVPMFPIMHSNTTIQHQDNTSPDTVTMMSCVNSGVNSPSKRKYLCRSTDPEKTDQGMRSISGHKFWTDHLNLANEISLKVVALSCLCDMSLKTQQSFLVQKLNFYVLGMYACEYRSNIECGPCASGEEELQPRQILPCSNAGLELLPLMPSKPGMPIHLAQDLNSQSSDTSTDSHSLEHVEAIMNEPLRLGPMIDTQDTPCSSNMPDDSIPPAQCRIEKAKA